MSRDRDFRKLQPAVQAELRRRAVVMVDDGKTRQQAADAVGVSRRFVGKWVTARNEVGDVALDGGNRGRRPGEQMVLAEKDAARIRRRIIDKCPDQLKLPFALWTREAVRDLIERETEVRLSLQSVSDYLKRWGFTPQRPVKRATERSEPAIAAWLATDYPAIVKRAKRENAEIQWADETGLSNQANYGRSFAPRGMTPVVRRLAARFSQSMISSLSNRGRLRFMVYDGALNTRVFLKFLRRLVRGAKRKVFLIVDNLRVHHARIVVAWVKANEEKIELIFLPAYAPERNPDEFLNNDVKQAMGRRKAPKDKAEMKQGLTSYMRGLQKRPGKVRAFFLAPSVRYAA
jgi:transposase